MITVHGKSLAFLTPLADDGKPKGETLSFLGMAVHVREDLPPDTAVLTTERVSVTLTMKPTPAFWSWVLAMRVVSRYREELTQGARLVVCDDGVLAVEGRG